MAEEVERRGAYFPPELTSRSVEPPAAPRGLCKVVGSLVLSLITYVLDVGSDVVLALGYAAKGETLKCAATIGVVYFSSLVTTYISVVWYRMVVRRRKSTIQHADYEEVLPDVSESFHARAVSTSNCCLLSIYILILFVFQAGPLMSILISLKMVWRQMQARKKDTTQNEAQLYQCEQVLHMISMHSTYEEMYECFLEAVPQSLLQISLLINDVIAAQGHFFTDFLSVWRVVTILLSVLKVKSAVWGYNSAVVTFTFLVRGAAQVDVRIGGLFVLRALWHLFIPVSHVMSLCYVAARFSLVASATMVFLHWLFMLVWLRDDFRGWGRTENFVMYVADAWLFVWMPFSSKTARKVSFYSQYYFIHIVERSSVLAICILTEQHPLPISVCVVSVMLFLLGLGFKMSYYLSIRRSHLNKIQH